MRIDAYMQVGQIYNTSKPGRPTTTARTGSSSDTLQISDFGKDYQIAKQATKGATDVREDKVQEIQQQLAAGTYNVSIESVADNLASRLMAE